MLSFLSVVILLSLAEIWVIKKNEKIQIARINVKRQAVELIQLPDLALTTEATWLRHRSLATPFSIFPEDGTLLDYYPASFVYQVQDLEPFTSESHP